MAGNDLSARDRDLMVRTILGEAANEGPRGQAAVAHVILNRTASGGYGKTPAQVVLAPNQFEPWSTKANQLMAIKPDSQAYRETSDIVDMVAKGDIADPTNGATHFLNPAIVMGRLGSLPGWATSPIAKIGNHTFYAPQGAVSSGSPSAVDPLDAINRAIAGD
jgi:spore germination cell wall hydrolase CwlJ-like protein